MSRYEVTSRPRMEPMRSDRFYCPRCNLMCLVFRPIFRDHRGAALYAREHGRLPQAKVTCVNGCHNRSDWGFKDLFNLPKALQSHVRMG